MMLVSLKVEQAIRIAKKIKIKKEAIRLEST